MRRFSIVGSAVTALLIAYALIVYFNPLHALWVCREQTITEKTSPDGRYVAVLMHRNCGATLPYVAHINLRLASSSPFPKKYFGGPINEGEIAGTALKRESGERFCWSSPHRLEIAYLTEGRNPGVWRDVSTGTDYPSCQ